MHETQATSTILRYKKSQSLLKASPISYTPKECDPFEGCDELCKYFAEGKQKDNDTNEAQKHLQLQDLSIREYLIDKYALWRNFRTINENALHGIGRRIENASEVITLQIERKAESAGALKAYICLIMDAQLNSKDGLSYSINC